MKIDAQNADKARQGLLNKKGKPYKPTRYAYRLQRLKNLNEYREMVRNTVSEATGGNIPTQYLFFFYFFSIPTRWNKKKRKEAEWTLHELRPDYSNLLKGIEDCLYEKDSECNAVSHYKIYVPDGHKEGLLIVQDEDIHKYIINTALELFANKPPTDGAELE
jgi:Holliday junction resolvase RusA-like endonuclease